MFSPYLPEFLPRHGPTVRAPTLGARGPGHEGRLDTFIRGHALKLHFFAVRQASETILVNYRLEQNNVKL